MPSARPGATAQWRAAQKPPKHWPALLAGTRVAAGVEGRLPALCVKVLESNEGRVAHHHVKVVWQLAVGEKKSPLRHSTFIPAESEARSFAFRISPASSSTAVTCKGFPAAVGLAECHEEVAISCTWFEDLFTTATHCPLAQVPRQWNRGVVASSELLGSWCGLVRLEVHRVILVWNKLGTFYLIGGDKSTTPRGVEAPCSGSHRRHRCAGSRSPSGLASSQEVHSHPVPLCAVPTTKAIASAK